MSRALNGYPSVLTIADPCYSNPHTYDCKVFRMSIYLACRWKDQANEQRNLFHMIWPCVQLSCTWCKKGEISADRVICDTHASTLWPSMERFYKKFYHSSATETRAPTWLLAQTTQKSGFPITLIVLVDEVALWEDSRSVGVPELEELPGAGEFTCVLCASRGSARFARRGSRALRGSMFIWKR